MESREQYPTQPETPKPIKPLIGFIVAPRDELRQRLEFVSLESLDYKIITYKLACLDELLGLALQWHDEIEMPEKLRVSISQYLLKLEQEIELLIGTVPTEDRSSRGKILTATHTELVLILEAYSTQT
jgi:hypothetical protein